MLCNIASYFVHSVMSLHHHVATWVVKITLQRNQLHRNVIITPILLNDALIVFKYPYASYCLPTNSAAWLGQMYVVELRRETIRGTILIYSSSSSFFLLLSSIFWWIGTKKIIRWSRVFSVRWWHVKEIPFRQKKIKISQKVLFLLFLQNYVISTKHQIVVLLNMWLIMF